MFKILLIASIPIGIGAFSTESHSRRAVIQQSLMGTFGTIVLSNSPQASVAVDDDLTRGGVALTPFNGLAFQYRGGNVNTGLDASTLTEPSIPYMEFLDRLEKGQVEFVEFMAPNGDAAYVTFKAPEGELNPKPIRIGEGYPIEDPEVRGISSHLFFFYKLLTDTLC
jgi:hypothetical protein